MNVSKIGNAPFKGLLTISGPDKETDVIVDTDKVSTVNKRSLIGPKGDSLLEGDKTKATIIMDNGFVINTFLPVENVVEAYKQAKTSGESKLETKFVPVITKPLIS